MLNDVDELKRLLKEKAVLLLQRERELYEFRAMRDRVETWLSVIQSLSLGVKYTEPSVGFNSWAKVMVSSLDFQFAAAFRIEPDNEIAHLVSGEPKGKLGASIPISHGERRMLQERIGGMFDVSTDDTLTQFARAGGLAKFHWVWFVNRLGTEYLLVTGFFAQAAKSHPMSASDHGHFRMVGSLLAAELNNAVLISEVEQDRVDLRRMNVELDKSIRDLRRTQDELVHSTRLASVGEMAGQTAHEVLNPITSIHGRLSRMLESQDQVYRGNLDVFEAVINAWRKAYQEEGFEGMTMSLMRPVGSLSPSDSEKTFFEDDMATLTALHAYFSKEGDRQAEAARFLLKEVDRVVRIVDGMRSLTKQRGTHTCISLHHLLEESSETLRDALDKRNIFLKINCEDRLQVFLDKYEFIQVMTNLLRNGMLAIEEKSGRTGGGITLDAKQNGNVVELRVTDTGIGIRKTHMPLLFEASFSSRASGKGTGLGLSISRRLVHGFGGEISVEKSNRDEGTTFLIVLPLDIESVSDGARGE